MLKTLSVSRGFPTFPSYIKSAATMMIKVTIITIDCNPIYNTLRKDLYIFIQIELLIGRRTETKDKSIPQWDLFLCVLDNAHIKSNDKSHPLFKTNNIGTLDFYSPYYNTSFSSLSRNFKTPSLKSILLERCPDKLNQYHVFACVSSSCFLAPFNSIPLG